LQAATVIGFNKSRDLFSQSQLLLATTNEGQTISRKAPLLENQAIPVRLLAPNSC